MGPVTARSLVLAPGLDVGRYGTLCHTGTVFLGLLETVPPPLFSENYHAGLSQANTDHDVCKFAITESVIFDSKFQRNRLSAGIHLGELTALSGLTSWIWGGDPISETEKGHKGMERKIRKKGKEMEEYTDGKRKRRRGWKVTRFHTTDTFFHFQPWLVLGRGSCTHATSSVAFCF